MNGRTPVSGDREVMADHWYLAARKSLFSPWRRIGGGVSLVLFGGIFLYFLLPEIRANVGAAGWMTTNCTILSSQVATTRDGEERGFLYRVDVRYFYQAAGDRYESTRYRFVDPFTDNGSAVETAVARFGPGAVVPCFVDPDDPRQAVLDRRVSPFLLIVLLPAAIAGLGLWEVAGVGVEFWRRST